MNIIDIEYRAGILIAATEQQRDEAVTREDRIAAMQRLASLRASVESALAMKEVA